VHSEDEPHTRSDILITCWLLRPVSAEVTEYMMMMMTIKGKTLQSKTLFRINPTWTELKFNYGE
jgi:hypothetical protein